MRHHLEFHPYHLQSIQELCTSGPENQLHFCVCFCRFIGKDIQKINDIYFFYEIWFHLNGYGNSQNFYLWNRENLHELRKLSLHIQKNCVVYTLKVKRDRINFFYLNYQFQSVPRHNSRFYSFTRDTGKLLLISAWWSHFILIKSNNGSG